MANESLPRKAREAFQRHKELSRNIEQRRASHSERWHEIKKKVIEGFETEDGQMVQEAINSVGEEVDRLEEYIAEFKRVGEELETVAVEARVEGSKLRSEALSTRTRSPWPATTPRPRGSGSPTRPPTRRCARPGAASEA